MNDDTIKSEKLKAIDIADYFVVLCNDAGISISNMKLQKLLYYAQAWYITKYNNKECLFDDDIKKWQWGPVCPPVYNKFKKYGSNNITELYNKDFDIEKFTEENKEKAKFIDWVLGLYGKHSASKLSDFTHAEDPWIDTELLATITKDSLYKYFYAKWLRVKKMAKEQGGIE